MLYGQQCMWQFLFFFFFSFYFLVLECSQPTQHSDAGAGPAAAQPSLSMRSENSRISIEQRLGGIVTMANDRNVSHVTEHINDVRGGGTQRGRSRHGGSAQSLPVQRVRRVVRSNRRQSLRGRGWRWHGPEGRLVRMVPVSTQQRADRAQRCWIGPSE